jgi:hypothetical protein
LFSDELQQLVAPIALYPDALVAQILGAATFPDQVASASGWLQQNHNLTGTPLLQAVDAQPWDPSVKALTQFPSVLDNLAKNLSWTSALGEAYHIQAPDVMTAVQELRAKAKAAGNLKSGSQITVVQQSPQVIVIQPTNPQVVYVPQYNPTVVYGTPVQTPGYSTRAVVATGLLAFGVGIAVGAAISNNNCCGWGYSYWNCNWHGGAVYYGNNAWHGSYYGSCVTAYGPNGAARAGTAYKIRRQGLTREAHQSRLPMALEVPVKPTTQTLGPMPPRVKPPTLTRTTEARWSQRTARPPTPSTKRQRKALWERYKLREAARALPRQAPTAIVLPRPKPQMATSMSRQTATSTRTPAAVGIKPRAPATTATSYAASRGYGQQAKSSGSSAFSSGGGGWQSRSASARGSASRGGFRR